MQAAASSLENLHIGNSTSSHIQFALDPHCRQLQSRHYQSVDSSLAFSAGEFGAMRPPRPSLWTLSSAIFCLCASLTGASAADPDYLDALTKSIIFYEGQRSGKVDLSIMRATWRDNSGLMDGFAQGVSASKAGGTSSLRFDPENFRIKLDISESSTFSVHVTEILEKHLHSSEFFTFHSHNSHIVYKNVFNGSRLIPRTRQNVQRNRHNRGITLEVQ